MKPMGKAWMLLKRQTRLGEHHPDFPSPHGPVTMRRLHPLESWYKDTDLGQSIPQEHRQPFHRLIQEGLKPVPASEGAVRWEDRKFMNTGKRGGDRYKPFDIKDKSGNWVFPAGEPARGWNMYSDAELGRGRLGIRMPIEQVQGQFRNRGYPFQGSDEPAEGFVQQHIPPEMLVRLPEGWVGGQSHFGERGEVGVE